MTEGAATKSKLIQLNPDYYEHFRDVLIDFRIAIVNAELRYLQDKRDRQRSKH